MRRAATAGSAGSSTISAPLRKATAASVAKPAAAPARAGGPLHQQVGAQGAYPSPAGDTRKSANSAANRSCTSVVDMVAVTCPCSVGRPARPIRRWRRRRSRPAATQRSPERVERLQRLGQAIHRDHLDIVPDGLPHLVELSRGHEERLVAGVAHGDGLLGAPAHRAHRAVQRHRAGDGHLVSARQLAWGEHVEDGEGEGQSGRRPTHGAGVDGDVDREVEGHESLLGLGDADDGARRVVLGGHRGHGHVDPVGAARRSLQSEGVPGTGTTGLEEAADLAGSVEWLIIHRHDHVVGLEHLRRRRARGDLPHDGACGADVHFLAEEVEGDGDGRQLRGVHQLCVVAPVLVLRPAAAHRSLRQHVDVIVEPADEGLQHRRGAHAHGGVGDRLLGGVARRPLHQHLLGDRAHRPGAQRDIGDLHDGRPEDRRQEQTHGDQQHDPAAAHRPGALDLRRHSGRGGGRR